MTGSTPTAWAPSSVRSTAVEATPHGTAPDLRHRTATPPMLRRPHAKGS